MAFGHEVTIHPLFRRRHRLSQMLRLLRRLLRGPGRIVVTTARTRDLALLALAAPGRLPARPRLPVFPLVTRDAGASLRFFRCDRAPATGHRDPRHDRDASSTCSAAADSRTSRCCRIPRPRRRRAPRRSRSGACSMRAPRARTRASGSSSISSNCSPRGTNRSRSRSRSRPITTANTTPRRARTSRDSKPCAIRRSR